MRYARVLWMVVVAVALALPVEAAMATWDPNPESNVTGYVLSYGTQSGVHPTTIDVGGVTSYQFFPPAGQRYFVVVQAYNSNGELSAKSAEVIVELQGTQNQPPVLTQPANQSTTLNAAVSLPLIATDPENAVLAYSATGLPTGLSVSTTTGVISGVVAAAGTYTVTASVSDGSLSATRTFTWTVTAAASQTTLVLSPIDTTIDIFGANYVNNQQLFAYTYPANRVGQAVLMKFNLAQVPANAVVQSATLQLSLVALDATTTDPNYSVSLHQVINRNPDLTRATGATADGVIGWTANACCHQGLPMAQADISPARAVTVVDRTLGVKTWDALSLVEAWRSAPATNYGLLLNADATKGNNRFRAFASMEHANTAQRPLLRIVYSVPAADVTAPVVSMSAPLNGTTVSGSAVNVSANASDAVGVVGVQFRLDGANLGIEDTTAPYAVIWNTTIAANGSHQLTAVARDAAGNSATSTAITVTVNNNRAPVLTQPANQNGAEGSAVSMALTASDPDGNALTFSATGLPSGLAINATSGLIAGTPAYTSAGTYSVTATVSDGSLSQSRTFSWTIADTNRAPVFTQPAGQTSAEGSAISFALTASDPDGNALTFGATGLPVDLAIDAASGVIFGTPSYSSAGTYSVTAIVTDGALSQSRTFSWTITDTNRAPVFAQPANQTTEADTDVTLQLSASDPDGAAVTYQAIGLPPALTIDASTGLISGRVIASSAGVHTVTITISDGALSTSRTFVWAVNDTDMPVPGDFDGDGRDDMATFRKLTGEWRVWPSAGNFAAAAPIAWGVGTDITVPADYDGDHRTDIAVYRPSTGTWHVLLSSTNMQSSLEIRWGTATDRPMPMDFDNDGRADLALPRFGGFDILLSGSNYTSSITVR